jgi:hypothetical protein
VNFIKKSQVAGLPGVPVFIFSHTVAGISAVADVSAIAGIPTIVFISVLAGVASFLVSHCCLLPILLPEAVLLRLTLLLLVILQFTVAGISDV